MKNNTKLFGVIALAVIIEFGITACYNTSFKNKEINTNGRLTITGLNDFEGQKIYVCSITDDSFLIACEHIEEQFFDGNHIDNYIFIGSITNGQASLKVYYIKKIFSPSPDERRYGFRFPPDYDVLEGYNGNDKRVYFHLDNDVNGTKRGYVIVDFTNGIGTGVFIEGGLYDGSHCVNLGGIKGDTIVDKAVNYVNANEEESFTLRLGSDIELTANTNRILKAGSLEIIGLDKERKIKLTSAGSIFTVEKDDNDDNNEHFHLDDNITLVGYNSNNSPVVIVRKGYFYMSGNSKITGNTSNTNGSGVYINSGQFNMFGNASISGNTSSANGGGVYIDGGTFNMYGNASISGNKSYANGGGIYINKGKFHIYGGTVYGSNESSSLANTASSGAALSRASDSSVAAYEWSPILPHTDGQQLYTNNTIVGKN